MGEKEYNKIRPNKKNLNLVSTHKFFEEPKIFAGSRGGFYKKSPWPPEVRGNKEYFFQPLLYNRNRFDYNHLLRQTGR
jgi:hypothetical protein